MQSDPGTIPRKASFLMASSGESGCLLPVLEVAASLVARGHRVVVHAPRAAEGTVASSGAKHLPYARYQDVFERARQPSERTPRFVPPRLHKWWDHRRFVMECARDLAEELEPILRRERFDCVAHESFAFGAGYAAERVGLPYASIGGAGSVVDADGLPLEVRAWSIAPTIRRRPWLAHALVDRLLPLPRTRAALGLPPRRERHAEYLQILGSPELHVAMVQRGFLPDEPLRDNQVFAGPIAFNPPRRDSDAPFSPNLEPGTVLVSTTTLGSDKGLFRRVLEAVAPMGIPVLGTPAGAIDIPSGLGDHIRIERFVPHELVFPHISAVICHGGWGTISRALRHRVPMLIIPLSAEQPFNAMQVEARGLGYRLSFDQATPEAIRARLRSLLDDGALRARMNEAGEEIRALKEQAVAAEALERLALRQAR